MGDQIEDSGHGSPRALALTAGYLHVVGFPAITHDRFSNSVIPSGTVAIRCIADWEIRHAAKPLVTTLQLLVCGEDSLGFPSLEDACTNGTTALVNIGFASIDSVRSFVSALVQKIDTEGAYPPSAPR